MKKVILLTGATDGIGLATAKMLAEQGHDLLLHGRSPARLEALVKTLSSENTNLNIESYLADLSNISEVKNMADAVIEKHKKIDVLINNAGVLKTPDVTTKEGLDIRFVVNTIAPYYLTKQLLPLLDKQARIVNLSSAAQSPINLDALSGKTQLDDMGAYSQSKLAITMWSRVMAEENKNGPIVIAVNPGSLLASKMVKEGFGIDGSDVNIGADILVRAALSDEFAKATGKYYDNDAKQFASPHPDALDHKKSEEVIAAVEAQLGGLIALAG